MNDESLIQLYIRKHVLDGWGFARFVFSGAKPERVLRSAWTYPTGSELRERKFAGPGPWRDVDWKMLRKKIAHVAKLIVGELEGIAPVDTRDHWSLPAAVASVRAGERVLANKYAVGSLRLPG